MTDKPQTLTDEIPFETIEDARAAGYIIACEWRAMCDKAAFARVHGVPICDVCLAHLKDHERITGEKIA